MNKIAILVFSMLMFTQSACSASFDCNKASTKVEKMICADSELSKLDEDLSTAYSKALKESSDPSALKQQQRDWIKERNKCADATCLKSTYQSRSNELKEAVQVEASSQPKRAMADESDRPGFYRLYKSTNDSVCGPLGKLINADIKKYGEIRFNSHSEFVRWHEVDGDVAKYTYDGVVKQADIDINNDGVVEQVIKTQWSIGNAPNDQLNIFQDKISSLTIKGLQMSKKTILFNPSNYWISRYKKKYDNLDFDWVLSGPASINLFLLDDKIYVVASNIYPPEKLAKIYVFQLGKDFVDYEENDVCMLLRTCPCGGCQGDNGEVASKALPAKKWCQ